MALRFFSEHQTWSAGGAITDDLWRIEIFDSSFVGEESEFIVADGARLSYRAEGDTPQAPILSSEFSFTMLIENETQEDLIIDMAAAAESRFTVVVYRDGVFYWAGVINSPDITIEDADYPYGFDIAAVDGLALLRNYEYREEGTSPTKWDLRYTGISRIMTIIERCIKKLPHIPEHFTGASKFMVTAVNWYAEDDPATPTATDDPLWNKYLDNRIFGGGQSSGNAKFDSCYDVLVKLLTPFNARIGLFDGYFLIEQFEHRAYTIGANANFSRYYDYDFKGPVANTNLVADQLIGLGETIQKLRGGSYSFLPPLRSARVTQQTNGLQNLIAGAYFDNDVTTYAAGSAVGDGSSTYVRFTGNVLWTIDDVDLVDNSYLYLHFRLKIELDSLFAEQHGAVSFNGTITTDALTWSATDEYIDLYFAERVIPDVAELTGSANFDLLLRCDPSFTSGNLNVSFDFVELLRYQPAGPNVDSALVVDAADYVIAWSMNEPYCVIMPNPKKIKISGLTPATAYPKAVTYEVQGDTNNTQVQQVNTVIGSLASSIVNQWGGLLYFDSPNYVYSGDWGARNGAWTRPFAQLLAQRVISAFYQPRKILRGTAVGSAIVLQTPIEERSEIYYLKTGTYDTVRDQMAGEWVGLEYTAAEFTYLDPEFDTGASDPNSPGGTGGVGGSSGGSNNGGGGTAGPGGVSGNGIYGGSGTVGDATVATMEGDFSFENVGATSGDAFTVTIDDGSESNTVKIEAGAGIILQSTGNNIQFEGVTRFSDIISPATINANQNDYAGLDGANVGRLAASTAVNITGLTSGIGGRVLFLFNRGSNNITLVDADTGSTAANRFDSGRNYVLRSKKGAIIVSDDIDNRYLVAAIGDLSYFNEGYTTSTATTASLTADTPATNVGVALVAKGSGATLAQIPDGTSAGGNARGIYAVDWQKIRTNSSDVASGDYSTIPGGRRCTASGTYSFATGFRGVASGNGSVAFGGSGAFSLGATASGANSFAMGPGATASGANSWVYGVGGFTATAGNSIGFLASSDKYGEFAGNGFSFMQLRKTFLVGASATELFLDGASLKATIPSGEKWIVEIACLAKISVVGDGTGGLALDDTYAVTYRCVIANKSGTTALVGTVQADMAAQADATMSDAVFTITADNTGDYLKVTYTGGANTGSSTQTNAYANLRVFKY